MGRVFIKGELRKVICAREVKALECTVVGGRKGKIEHGVMGGC